MDTTLGIILLVALIVISAAITVYYIVSEKREGLPKGDKREAISKKKTTKGLIESKEISTSSITGSLITKGKEAEPDKTDEPPVDGKSLYAFVFSNPVRVCAWCQAENVFGAVLCEVCGMSFYQEDE